MTMPFGEGADAEVFKYSLFLVLCNRLTTCAVAILMLVVSFVLWDGVPASADLINLNL